MPHPKSIGFEAYLSDPNEILYSRTKVSRASGRWGLYWSISMSQVS